MTLLLDALHEAGLRNFDVATLTAMPLMEDEEMLLNTIGMYGRGSLYVGSDQPHHVDEKHEHLSGVRKSKRGYLPFSKRMEYIISKEGRELSDEEWREIFGIEETDRYNMVAEKLNNPEKIKEFRKREREPLTTEEIKEIQKKINFARKDTVLLADRVVAQVWNENKVM